MFGFLKSKRPTPVFDYLNKIIHDQSAMEASYRKNFRTNGFGQAIFPPSVLGIAGILTVNIEKTKLVRFIARDVLVSESIIFSYCIMALVMYALNESGAQHLQYSSNILSIYTGTTAVKGTLNSLINIDIDVFKKREHLYGLHKYQGYEDKTTIVNAMPSMLGNATIAFNSIIMGSQKSEGVYEYYPFSLAVHKTILDTITSITSTTLTEVAIAVFNDINTSNISWEMRDL